VSAETRYLAGLKAGWIDESLGVKEPESGYPVDEPYLHGVRRGREAWRREAKAVVEPDWTNWGER
jgi:hypothetical protein